MALATVTLKLRDLGLAVRPGVAFSLQFRDPHEVHTVADATVDTSVIYSAATDSSGSAQLQVNASGDFVLGSGVYVAKVGNDLTEAIWVPQGTTSLKTILEAGAIPQPSTPPAQLGWLARATEPTFAVPYLGWFDTANVQPKYYDPSSQAWEDWPGGGTGGTRQIHTAINIVYDPADHELSFDTASTVNIGHLVWLVTPDDIDRNGDELELVFNGDNRYDLNDNDDVRVRARELTPGRLYQCVKLASPMGTLNLRIADPLGPRPQDYTIYAATTVTDVAPDEARYLGAYGSSSDTDQIVYPDSEGGAGSYLWFWVPADSGDIIGIDIYTQGQANIRIFTRSVVEVTIDGIVGKMWGSNYQLGVATAESVQHHHPGGSVMNIGCCAKDCPEVAQDLAHFDSGLVAPVCARHGREVADEGSGWVELRALTTSGWRTR